METKSFDLFKIAQKLIPGGVNSPVRACKNVASIPLFIESAKGAYITDVDGNTYIDYVLSWGPMILGHAHPEVSQAIIDAVHKGTSYGAPCEAEVILAQKILKAMPRMDMIRMVNSGTEATMSALRLARAVTARPKVVKFIGCYHGHADAFLAAAGSGLATLSIPGTPGVPDCVIQDTLLAPYNDTKAVQDIFSKHGHEIAAIIVEPCAANMGLVLPVPGFLLELRKLCDEHKSLLIFDEVITGFRLGYGGAQELYNITPDLTTLGKIIGGGLPVGAYAGKAEYMQQIAPEGDVYQAGTLSGNPIAMVAGIATLNLLEKADYTECEVRTATFATELQNIFNEKNIPCFVQNIGMMFCPFFRADEVINFKMALDTNTNTFTEFYKHMRKHNVYIAPAAFEAGMISFAHSQDDFAKTLEAARKFNIK